MKTWKLLIATAIVTMAMSFTAFAGEWKQDDIGWWYQYDDGSYASKEFLRIDSVWYYFDDTGYMKTGWYHFKDGWYGFGDSGAAMNPCDYTTHMLIASPYEGWTEYSADAVDTANGLANGSVVYFNNRYWSDSNEKDTVVYYHDVAPEPIKDRFGLAN